MSGRSRAPSVAGDFWRGRLRPAGGFTLIEIMVVVGIMAIVLTMGVPIVYRLVKKEPMRQAVSDIVEICSEARARAILQSAETKLVFRPDGSITIEGGGGAAPARPAAQPEGAGNLDVNTAVVGASNKGSVKLGESITFEMLELDHISYMDQESMSVSFRPNGTCDEMVLILLSEKGERAKIWIEITTGLAFVETNPMKF